VKSLNVHVALVWARSGNEAKARSTNEVDVRNSERIEAGIAETHGELNQTAFQMKTKILRVSRFTFSCGIWRPSRLVRLGVLMRIVSAYR
jgi:hypothetical protein